MLVNLLQPHFTKEGGNWEFFIVNYFYQLLLGTDVGFVH